MFKVMRIPDIFEVAIPEKFVNNGNLWSSYKELIGKFAVKYPLVRFCIYLPKNKMPKPKKKTSLSKKKSKSSSSNNEED